jgi:Double zinc ribbon domain
MEAFPPLDAEQAAGPPWAHRAGALAARLAHTALDTLYPPTCLACRAATARHGALCPRCWSTIRFIERPYCERLGTPFEHDLGQGLISPQAMADPPAFGRARAVARFEDGPARTLVHRLKYSDRAELARPIASWMARAGADVLAEADLLTPVPLHYGCGGGGSTKPPRCRRKFLARRANGPIWARFGASRRRGVRWA